MTYPRESAGLLFFFFNDTATTEIYTLSLHDALPICRGRQHCHVDLARHGFGAAQRPVARDAQFREQRDRDRRWEDLLSHVHHAGDLSVRLRGARRGDERQDRSSLASVVGSPDPERDSGAAVFEMEEPWASSQVQTRSARYSAGGIACCAASEPAAWGPFTSRSTSC